MTKSASEGIIIAAFATCGKSILGKKYKNVIDLESSYYKHDSYDVDLSVEERKGTNRKVSPKWPQNYYNAINEAARKYDVVLVQLTPWHFDYFDKNGIKYSIAYPSLKNWDEVEKRCIKRGNNGNFINRLKEVFAPFYDDVVKRKYEKLYILEGEETLEDCLIKDGIKLYK